MSTIKCATLTKKYDTAEDVGDLVRQIEDSADQLETLSLEANSFGIEPAKEIGSSLTVCPNLTHLLLNDMFTSRLKDEIPTALSYIFDGVKTSGAQLITLDLSDNAIGPVTMPALVPFLESDCCSTLQALRLNNCGLGTRGGAMLAVALPKLQQLTELVIGRNRLEIDGIRDISCALSQLSNLEALELPQNGTKDEGIDALARAIKANCNLRVLNLNDNVLKRKDAVLGEAIAALEKIEKLNFGDCLLSTEGAITIMDSVRSTIERTDCSFLQEIWLNGNEIGPRALDSIINAVSTILAKQSSENLFTLNMSCNNLGEDGCNRLFDVFSISQPQIDLVIDDDDGTADEREQDDDGEEGEGHTLDVSYDDHGEEKNHDHWDESQLGHKDLKDLTDLLVTISVNAYHPEASGLADKVVDRVTRIYEESIRRNLGQYEFLNALLVSFGLLKDEDLKGRKHKVDDLRGPLLAVKTFAAKLSTDQKKCLKVFLDHPTLAESRYTAVKTELLSELWKF